MNKYTVTDVGNFGGNSVITVKGVHSEFHTKSEIISMSGERYMVLTSFTDEEDVTTTILVAGNYEKLEDFEM